MIKRLLLLFVALFAMMFFVQAKSALAQTRVWVNTSGGTPAGNDASCTGSMASPCATFAKALTLAGSGGQINCLSDGDYGPLTITANVRIDCGSNMGYIDQPTSGSAAITITGGTAVTLRNITIHGFGTGRAGINVTNAASNINLHVENCVINGFKNGGSASSHAILFQPSGSRNSLAVIDSQLGDNPDGGSGYGIQIIPATSGEIVAINFIGDIIGENDIGVSLDAGAGVIVGEILNSNMTYNNGNGVQASGTAFVTIDGSTVVDNLGTGIASLSTGAQIQVNSTTITGNGTGVNGSAVLSFGNNRLDLNGSNGSFGSTEPLQ